MLGEIAYTLDIRPTFVDELDRAVEYIERKFKNPIAADNLINDILRGDWFGNGSPVVQIFKERSASFRISDL